MNASLFLTLQLLGYRIFRWLFNFTISWLFNFTKFWWYKVTYYIPLKWGGLVCPPLEGPMISNGPEGNLCESAESVGE